MEPKGSSVGLGSIPHHAACGMPCSEVVHAMLRRRMPCCAMETDCFVRGIGTNRDNRRTGRGGAEAAEWDGELDVEQKLSSTLIAANALSTPFQRLRLLW